MRCDLFGAVAVGESAKRSEIFSSSSALSARHGTSDLGVVLDLLELSEANAE